MKWELLDIDKMNPMDLVRIEGSSKCLKEIRTLSGEEFGFLLKELDQPVVRTMCIVTACLGLRVSETLGLRWGDFDWKRMQVHIQRGFVTGHVGDVKTRKSSTQLPIHPSLMKALLDYRSEMAPDASDTDWLFPSPRGTGKPRRAWSVQLRYLIPAGIRAGVGRIGWHTFRHTYSTMLRALEVDVKVQQDLLRHADIRTTMNIYTHAIPKAMRAAHGKVVDLLLPTASGEDQNRGSNRAAITVLPGSKAFRPMPASTA
jgi:integrase